MSKVLHDEDNAKAIAIPQIFSENSRAKNGQETLCEKEKMLATSIFSFSHNGFQKASFSGLLKVRIVR